MNLFIQDAYHSARPLYFAGCQIFHILIGVLSKRMASLIKSPIEERAVLLRQPWAVVMLGMKHFILSVWGLRKLRKLWNHEWRLFFSLLMKAKPLVLLEPRAFLSVPFPSSLLPHRETFYQRKPSVCPEAATSLIAWAPSYPFSCSPYRLRPQPDFSLLLFADHIERVILLKEGSVRILN